MLRSVTGPKGTVYWMTKDLQDMSCENAQWWGLENNQTGRSEIVTSSVCTNQSYMPQACLSANDGPWWKDVLDFIIRPALAASLSTCSVPAAQVFDDGGGASETSGIYPISGSNNSGTKPNLKINSLQPETAAHVVTSSFHIGESARCRMQIKNSGTANAGAFQTRCYISDGFKTDDNPSDEGKEDSQSLNINSTKTEHEDFIASEYPGQFNMMACTDSASQIAELKEDDQCEEEVPFTVWSSPNLTLTQIYFSNGLSAYDPGQSIPIHVSAANLGENFGKTIRVGWYITGGSYGTDEVFLDYDSIKRENLKGGTTHGENLGTLIAPETPGTYTVIARIDYDDRIAETNEGDNQLSISFTVNGTVPPGSADDDDLFMMLLF